ncbi:MAG: hypothetical protein M1825_005726 [Sarcosagium campestre]|nr:MAG: hypothetical protein M1825_005726 [Sarcosagium campestre]
MASSPDSPHRSSQRIADVDEIDSARQPVIAAPSTDPLELSNLPKAAHPISSHHMSDETKENMQSAGQVSPMAADTSGLAISTDKSASATDTSPGKSDPAASPEAPQLKRETSTAIGPSSDQPTFKAVEAAGPIIMITLLLTTGARHPFKIDEKYLKKRNVKLDGNDPFSLSVYTLKELIWREWREEWEPRPSSPSSIRLIHFGRLLEDSALLRECRFNAESPNVVHMTVRPQDLVDEEDAKAGKGGSGSNTEGGIRTPRCRCSVM